MSIAQAMETAVIAWMGITASVLMDIMDSIAK